MVSGKRCDEGRCKENRCEEMDERGLSLPRQKKGNVLGGGR